MSKNSKIKGDELAVGGQAVLEGVMMRGKRKAFVSIRAPSGKIVSKRLSVSKPSKCALFLRKIPFVRGVLVLADSLRVGYSALNYSAQVALPDEEEPSPVWTYLSVFASVLIALLLFKFLPFTISNFIATDSWFVIVEGIVKFFIFVGYIWIISLLPDIRRVFEYHGAEHKAIHCYEAFGLTRKLNAVEAQKFSRIHPRCGTTFLFLVILISIVVYAVIPLQLGFWLSFLVRLAFLPVIMGVSYELLRIVPRLSLKNPLRWILFTLEWPGLLLQKITTREPDITQLRVAIHALKKVL